jgi:hypothetical protein
MSIKNSHFDIDVCGRASFVYVHSDQFSNRFYAIIWRDSV